jgi:alpha-L-fucosidase
MKKRFILLYLILSGLSFSAAKAQQKYQPSRENLAAREWFKEARFGMFVHWGASSVLGDGEWVMNNRNIKVEDYSRLQNFFNPQEFDAKKWVATAKAAGMKYITFITRHHDSFSNWDTKQSDWKITNTPYGKDVLKALAQECKEQDMKLFLYYSTLDWYRTDYQYQTGRTGKGTGRREQGDWNKYIAFMKAQLTELLTNYGEIGGIWFDGHWDQTEPEGAKDRSSRVDWHYDEIYSLIHKLQPQCLVGNNHHLAPLPGEDFQMFERDLPGENKSGLSFQTASEELPLESCETINGSWGFNITDDKYKSTAQIIRLLANAAGLNANLLLNIGPMPDGAIQPEFTSRLDSVGKWMVKYGNSIYGTRGSPLRSRSWGTVTQKEDQLFIHIFDAAAKTIVLENFQYKPGKLISLTSGKPIKYKYRQGHLEIDLRGIARDEANTVLSLAVR